MGLYRYCSFLFTSCFVRKCKRIKKAGLPLGQKAYCITYRCVSASRTPTFLNQLHSFEYTTSNDDDKNQSQIRRRIRRTRIRPVQGLPPAMTLHSCITPTKNQDAEYYHHAQHMFLCVRRGSRRARPSHGFQPSSPDRPTTSHPSHPDLASAPFVGVRRSPRKHQLMLCHRMLCPKKLIHMLPSLACTSIKGGHTGSREVFRKPTQVAY